MALRTMGVLKTPLVRRTPHEDGEDDGFDGESSAGIQSRDDDGRIDFGRCETDTMTIECAPNLTERSAEESDGSGEKSGSPSPRAVSKEKEQGEESDRAEEEEEEEEETGRKNVLLPRASDDPHEETETSASADEKDESDAMDSSLPADVLHPMDQTQEVMAHTEEQHVPSEKEIDDIIARFFGDQEELNFDEYMHRSSRVNRYMAEGLGMYEHFFLPLFEPIQNYLRKPDPYSKCGTLTVNGKRAYHVEIRGGIMYRYSDGAQGIENLRPRKTMPLDKVHGLRIDPEDHNSFWIVKDRKRNRRTKYTAVNAKASQEWQFCILLYLLSSYDNRHGSNYPIRHNIEASWFVDGEDYYRTVAMAMLEAKKEIFICGWCVNLQIYLVRSTPFNVRWRLDKLLYETASRDVRIYVILWKDLEITGMNLMSQRTKRELRNLHPNIHCITHPNTTPFKWTHHQKCVIIDQRLAFLGGLDLCFGRYDTPNHQLVDNCHLRLTWPGYDYYNPEFAGYQKQSDPRDAFKDILDRDLAWRQPWHDVQCSVRGAIAKDVAANFISRWNHHLDKKKKTRDELYDLEKQMPPLVIHEPDTEDEPQRVRKRDRFKQGVRDRLAHIRDLGGSRSVNPDSHTLSNQFRQLRERYHGRNSSESSPAAERDIKSDVGARSRDHNRDGDDDRAPNPTDSFSDTGQQLRLENHNLSGPPSRVENSLPRHRAERLQSPSFRDQILGPFRSPGQGRIFRVNGQVLRSIGQWSGSSQTERSIHDAYIELIRSAKYYVYIENQYFCSSTAGRKIKNRIGQAIVDRVRRAINEKSVFRVIIVLPQRPDGGVFENTTQQVMKWQNRTIWSTETSVMGQLMQDFPRETIDRYISFFSLQQYGFLNCRPITNQIYVHSKIMIVDDRSVIIGSANINDRSMLGSRDSEICVQLEDNVSATSYMNGKLKRVSKFAKYLRVHLWKEHLGLLYESREDAAVSDIVDGAAVSSTEALKQQVLRRQKNLIKSPVSWLLEDPICSMTYNGLWRRRASRNTAIYSQVFPTFPDPNRHRTIDDYRRDWREWETQMSAEGEHVVRWIQEAKKNLAGVRGHVVHFPLFWLIDEKFKKDVHLSFLEDQIFF